MLLMVLADGETYSALEGSKILWVQDAYFKEHHDNGDLDQVVKDMVAEGQGTNLTGQNVKALLRDHIVLEEGL